MNVFLWIFTFLSLISSSVCQNRNVIIQGTQVIVDGSTVSDPVEATSIAQSFSAYMSSAMAPMQSACFPFCHDNVSSNTQSAASNYLSSEETSSSPSTTGVSSSIASSTSTTSGPDTLSTTPSSIYTFSTTSSTSSIVTSTTTTSTPTHPIESSSTQTLKQKNIMNSFDFRTIAIIYVGLTLVLSSMWLKII